MPAGGLSADHQRWIHTSHPLFLLPIPVLRTVFRSKFLDGLRQLYRKDLLDCRGPAADFRDPAWFEELTARLGKKKWFVYAKPPFGGPAHVLRYLGRYTHRMAISNHRLTAFDGEQVSFRWRDYAHGSKQRVMTLDAVEFLRRFFLHVLPRGFVRIRHYGLLSNRFRNRLLPLAHELLAAQGREQLPLPPPPDCELWHCPRCGKAMRVVERFTAAQLYLARLRFLMTACCQSALPACSTHVFAAVCAQHARTASTPTFNAIPERLDRRRFMQLLTACHHHRRPWKPQKAFNQSQTAFNIHNSHPHHRDRRRLRLPSYLQIETASRIKSSAHPNNRPACARRFRCWLAVTHPPITPHAVILSGAQRSRRICSCLSLLPRRR